MPPGQKSSATGIGKTIEDELDLRKVDIDSSALLELMVPFFRGVTSLVLSALRYKFQDRMSWNGGETINQPRQRSLLFRSAFFFAMVTLKKKGYEAQAPLKKGSVEL